MGRQGAASSSKGPVEGAKSSKHGDESKSSKRPHRSQEESAGSAKGLEDDSRAAKKRKIAEGGLLESLPGVRVQSKASEDTDKNKNKKMECAFLCGSICQETPDPIHEDRKSIRWAYDRADVSHSSTQGGNDYYCERTWVTYTAHTVKDRCREYFQSLCAKDKDVLNEFLKNRQSLIERHKKLASKPKRAGSACGTSRGRVTTIVWAIWVCLGRVVH